ncbi:MAG: helix-turn-helix domain-containing protein [Sphingorhabdus sp.]
MEIHVDTVIRLMSVGASLLLLLLILVGRVRWSLKIALAGLLIGGSAYLINSSSFLPIPQNFRYAIDLISLITPFWTWLFARIIFERAPSMWLLGILALFYVTGWALANFFEGPHGIGFYIIHITSLALVINLVYVAISGFRDDLIDKRRLIRIFLPLLVGLQAGGILIYELIYGTELTYSTAADDPLIQTINGLLIFTLVLLAGLALLNTEADLLAADESSGADETSGAANLSPSQTVLHDKLTSAMSTGGYREAGLTIQTLAETLGAPEHRLRALINRKLGHRNFSSFLNGYRIGEAKEKLADRDAVDLPILTIAMDLGYNSLAPFNRAFRTETGQTPSDFRKSAIDQN